METKRASRFQNVSCSQCGQSFGPGDHGYSHCIDHQPLSDHVAWCRYARRNEQPTQIRLCDSDAEGAFKVFRHSQWIPVAERLPTHIYAVIIWVVGGRLYTGEDYMDVGIYRPEEGDWRAGMYSAVGKCEDETVEVAMWLDPSWPNRESE